MLPIGSTGRLHGGGVQEEASGASEGRLGGRSVVAVEPGASPVKSSVVVSEAALQAREPQAVAPRPLQDDAAAYRELGLNVEQTRFFTDAGIRPALASKMLAHPTATPLIVSRLLAHALTPERTLEIIERAGPPRTETMTLSELVEKLDESDDSERQLIMLAFSPQVDAFFERGDEVDDVYAMLQSVPDRSYVDALGSQGFAAADVRELWSLGVTQAEIGQLRELGYSAVEMMDFKKLGASMDHAEELLKLGFMRGPALARLGITAGHSSEQIAKLDALKFTPQQIADMGLFGTSPETAAAGLEAGHTHATTVAFAKEYLRLGIPLNPSTISTVSARSSLDELGAGNLNTVYEGMYSWSGAVAEPTVFKPIAAPVVAGTASLDSSVLGQHIGVLEHDPKFAERNLATDAAQRWGHTLAQSLDIDMPSVYVATSLGLSRGSQTVGVVMKYSPGVPARELSAAQLRSPEFRRQAMWLQVWDQILGQGDRHSGNYLYTVDGDGKARIAAIDNDLCCGSNQHPEALRYERGKNDHARGVGLPPVIDTEMAALLKAMTADDLKAVFKNILPEAADAAVARLGVLKAHALELQQAGQVVTSSQWSGSVATEALADPTRSYAGRELARALTLAAE